MVIFCHAGMQVSAHHAQPQKIVYVCTCCESAQQHAGACMIHLPCCEHQVTIAAAAVTLCHGIHSRCKQGQHTVSGHLSRQCQWWWLIGGCNSTLVHALFGSSVPLKADWFLGMYKVTLTSNEGFRIKSKLLSMLAIAGKFG